jgi:CrcB protein
MPTLIAVAAGGAFGAALRYLFAAQIGRLLGPGFPWGILATNILGSFVMGVLVEGLALKWNLSPEMRAFLTVGVLGGFTTFSSFSLDTVLLWQRGEVIAAAVYVAASVCLSIAALVAGLLLVRSLA